MAIYDKSGAIIFSAYDIDGSVLQNAYDIEGNLIFQNGTLKIMTYNVGGWYIGSGTNVPADKDTAYYALQNGMIANADADILCIEELWATFSQSGRTAVSLLSQYYPYIQTAGGTTTYMGRAICSKYPITSYTQHTFAGETRYYDCAVINVNGVSINVFVTHLHPSDIPTRIAEATELHGFIEAQALDKYIICGDFNSPLHDPFSEQNTGVYQQFLDDGCTIANGGAFGILDTACNSTDWAQDAFAIDNIIASNYFTFETVETDLTKTTDTIVEKIDHVPLIAELVIN